VSFSSSGCKWKEKGGESLQLLKEPAMKLVCKLCLSFALLKELLDATASVKTATERKSFTLSP